jgi:hypothetical protein
MSKISKKFVAVLMMMKFLTKKLSNGNDVIDINKNNE